MAQDKRGISRRGLLKTSGLLALTGALTSCQIAPVPVPTATTPALVPPTSARVEATGRRQAGIDRPALPQAVVSVGVYDLVGDPAAAFARLGEVILELTTGMHPDLQGFEPGDLTVTIGAGPRLVANRDPDLPGSTALSAYPRETIATGADGGDVLIQICASDPLVVPLARLALDAAVPEIELRWQQRGFRGPYERVNDTLAAPRNVLGFVDGIAIPHTAEDVETSVWIAEGGAADSCIAVVRRMTIDLTYFQSLTTDAQNAIIGRDRRTSAPLSGGSISDDVNLQAKTPDGRYLVPLEAHARRAHPSAVGATLMLRRSYSMDEPVGLLFISFQRELRTFTATMARMSEADALLERTTTTATGTFLILPGFSETEPLGSTIFGAR